MAPAPRQLHTTTSSNYQQWPYYSQQCSPIQARVYVLKAAECLASSSGLRPRCSLQAMPQSASELSTTIALGSTTVPATKNLDDYQHTLLLLRLCLQGENTQVPPFSVMTRHRIPADMCPNAQSHRTPASLHEGIFQRTIAQHGTHNKVNKKLTRTSGARPRRQKRPPCAPKATKHSPDSPPTARCRRPPARPSARASSSRLHSVHLYCLSLACVAHPLPAAAVSRHVLKCRCLSPFPNSSSQCSCRSSVHSCWPV